MAYQALYRKWRPKDFSSMVGQEAIVETLRHQVQTGRVAHAYLFCGSRGTGKTSAAKILARAINCLNPRNGDPCGVCDMCQRTRSDEYMDILEFDAASNSRVEDARELLEKVSFPPQFGTYKVYIIDEVHMLSNSAFNALLKTLEEPPNYLVFILATTEPHKLPATILSRCQRFDFGRIPSAQIQGRLRDAVLDAECEATDDALMMIARAAEGGMRDALSILDMCLGYGKIIDEKLVRTVLGTSDRSFLFQFSNALKEEDAAKVLLLIDELMKNGKDPLVFSRDFSAHLRNLVLSKYCSQSFAETINVTEEDAREYRENSEDFSTSRLMDMLDLFMRLETDLRYSGSPRIALENTSLKCCLRTKEADILAINDRMTDLENKINRLEILFSQKEVHKEKQIDEKMSQKMTMPVKASQQSQKNTEKHKTLTDMKKSTDEIWKEALKNLQKTEPGTHGMFLMGDYQGSDGIEYQWKARPGFEFIAASLNSAERKGKIEEALSSAAGLPCSFVAIGFHQKSKNTEDTSDEAYLQELRNTFGEEPVDVVDSLPE